MLFQLVDTSTFSLTLFKRNLKHQMKLSHFKTKDCSNLTIILMISLLKNASCEIATKRPKGQIILIATEICTRVNIEHSMYVGRSE